MDQTKLDVGRLILGQGAAGAAADNLNLNTMWKKAVMDGETDLDFPSWIQQYKMQQGGGTVGGLMHPTAVGGTPKIQY